MQKGSNCDRNIDKTALNPRGALRADLLFKLLTLSLCIHYKTKSKKWIFKIYGNHP